jgi:ABC-type nitrate/sulfonate/bicarbonate transport system substrate-binding protein
VVIALTTQRNATWYGFALVGILVAHGLSESDVKEVNLQSAEVLPALTSGLVNAVVGSASLAPPVSASRRSFG